MRREASIPLFLWAATAALAHLLWGGGADQAARLIDERLDVGRFAAGVRNHVRGGLAPPIEIALDDGANSEEPKPDEKPQDLSKDDPSEEEEQPDEAEHQPEPPKPEPPRPESPRPEPPKAEEPPKLEPPKPEPAKPEATPAEPKVVPELVLPKRIAVKQHVDNEKQDDNPDAKYIADNNNRVKEETVARITSTDQDARKPSPGSAPSAPKEAPGNAEETHVRQDSEQAGDPGKAPGGAQSEKAARASAAAPAEQVGKAQGATAPGAPGQGAVAKASPPLTSAQDKNQVAQPATPERAGTQEALASEDGAFSIKAPEAASPEQRARKAKKRLPPRRPKSLIEALGLGAAGRTASGVALNLTPNLAAEAIGSDELSRLRRTDGERRRSQHRGSWRTPSFERYRSAIENYIPSVKPGNQTALNTAAVPFASYLNQIHNRIHPIFADDFLSSLERLPASHPMNDPTLVTAVEIVVEREEGRLVRRGVVSTSGVTAFDINAIAAVDRAAPFGAPPSEIISPDGNVYLHWEFRRDQMACSTLFAHPFIKRAEPKPAPLPTTPPQPPFRGPDDEAPVQSGDRHGRLELRAGPSEIAPPG